mgnify:CR=1 FL=1
MPAPQHAHFRQHLATYTPLRHLPLAFSLPVRSRLSFYPGATLKLLHHNIAHPPRHTTPSLASHPGATRAHQLLQNLLAIYILHARLHPIPSREMDLSTLPFEVLFRTFEYLGTLKVQFPHIFVDLGISPPSYPNLGPKDVLSVLRAAETCREFESTCFFDCWSNADKENGSH